MDVPWNNAFWPTAVADTELTLTEFVFMTHDAFFTRHNDALRHYDAFQMTRPKMRHNDAFL